MVLLGAGALALVNGVFRVDDTVGVPTLAAYAVATAGALALLVRHRSAALAVVATAVAAVLAPALGELLTPFAVVPLAVAGYAVAARRPAAEAAAVLLPAVLVPVAVTALLDEVSWQDGSRLVVVAALPLAAAVLGHAAQSRRAYLEAVEERARRAEATRESEALRRVEEERLRIARELHDVVAHQVTLANAQAVVAAHVLDTRPEEARANLEALVATTADALDDLRATVGLLRHDEDADGPAEPAPGLARLPELVASFGRAGLTVEVTEDGDPRPLPPGTDLTAYRIVQEALTNVTKHSGSTRARVRLTWHRDRLGLTVSDDGSGVRLTPAGRPPGHGIIGMRERAAALGGQLSADRTGAGGFEVISTLPLPGPRA